MPLPRPTAALALAAALASFGLAPEAGALATNGDRQPLVDLALTTSTYYGGPGQSVAELGGSPPVSLSDAFTAPVPPYSTNDCSGNAAGVAGVGMPAASAAIVSGYAGAECPPGSMALPSFDSAVNVDTILLYKLKGPDAVAAPSAATLFMNVHGTLSTAKDFGSTPNNAVNLTDFSVFAEVYSEPLQVNLIGALIAQNVSSGSLKSYYDAPAIVAGTDLVDQSTASQSVYGIDHSYQSAFARSGWLTAVVSRLTCHAQAQGVFTTAESASCDFDFGDTSAYIESALPKVLFERVPSLKPTTPRSAAYLSPANAPIQPFPGTPGIPSTASGSGDLGQGTTGGGDASGDLPLVNSEFIVKTGASSHIDQPVTAAGANGTVATEGQGAASLVYHVTRLNGYTGPIPVTVSYDFNGTVSATKGLDPSILQRSSFELSGSVAGVPFFHFVTLALGSSNEDPPGLSGDLSDCTDASTSTTQVCSFTRHLAHSGAVHEDKDDNIVLTVQSDCATSLAHPSGPLPDAHPACDASHTVTAKLVNATSPYATLTAVPEPGAGPLAFACAGALAALRRRAAKRAC